MTREYGNGELRIQEDVSDDEWQKILQHLGLYNFEQSRGLSGEPGIQIRLLAYKGNFILGGISCRAYYRSLTVDHLWIKEEHRGKGYGRELLLAAEEIAKKEGCISSHTSTYSFQAPEFYQKLGYEIVGVFDKYPNEIKQFFLEKTL